MNDLISVIVPLFNKEKLIKRCITSLVEQTYQNLEIIIIDDGSIDNSKKIVEEIFDSRIKIYSIENQGVSNARNFGIEKSNGKYLMFVDADDYVSNTYVSSMIENYRNDVDLIATGRKDVYDDQVNNSYLCTYKGNVNEIPESFYINGFCHSVWAKLYKKQIIDDNKISFPKINISEDSFFNISYLENCKKVEFKNLCEYYYVHYNSNNLTSFSKYNYFQIYAELFDRYCDYFKNKKNNYSKQIIYPQFYNLILKIVKNEKIYEINKNDILNDVHKKYIVNIFEDTKSYGFENVIKSLMIKKYWGLLKMILKFI